MRYRVGDAGRALGLLAGSDYAATATGDNELVVQIKPEDAGGGQTGCLVWGGIEVTGIATVSIDLETFLPGQGRGRGSVMKQLLAAEFLKILGRRMTWILLVLLQLVGPVTILLFQADFAGPARRRRTDRGAGFR